MNKNSTLWFFLVLIQLLIMSSAIYGEIINDTKIDSLRKELNKKIGTDKISSQLDLALQIINKNKNEAQILANSALVAAKTIGNKNLKMRSFYVLGRIYTELENEELSLTYLDSALQISEAIRDNWYKGEILYHVGVNKRSMGEDLQALESFKAAIMACRLSDNYKIMGSSYSLMATIFRMNGLYDRAIEYIIKSKLNYEKADYLEGGAWAAYLLGRIYSDLKNPQKALEYFQEALNLYLRLAAIDGNKNGVAICYEQIGLLNIESGNFEVARENIENALKIYSNNNSKYGISNIYKYRGIIEYSMGNYTEAENQLNEALRSKEEMGDLFSMPSIEMYLGLSQIKRGGVDEGFKTIEKGLALAISNNQKKIQLDIYSKLTETYLGINDLENAMVCQNKQIQIQNSIASGAANIKMEQLQAIYEIDEKSSQIAELEKQNKINALSIKQNSIIRNIMIIGIILALFISIIIYWFYYKLRHKNRELYVANAAKDKFFAIIAHDLRGPTGTLAALLEHLNSSFDDFSSKELKEILLTLYKSAENVSNLLENLLIWAQSQVAKIEYRPTKLKLSEVLQNSLDGLSQSAEYKQIDIRVERNDMVFVLADPDMLQTILRNILSNAIKFSHRGGSVIVKSALNDKNTVLLSIKDSGIGIAKSKLTKIFEITNTHHTTGTEDEKSTGLGLILVKDFVEKNKGTLTIESEKDKGTIVSFTLPITQEPGSSVKG